MLEIIVHVTQGIGFQFTSSDIWVLALTSVSLIVGMALYIAIISIKTLSKGR